MLWSYTHIITILCVYKCVTWNFTFLAIVYHIIFFVCCRASANCVVSEFIYPNPPAARPPARPASAAWFAAVKETASDPHKWSPTLFSECHGASSHEDESVCAEIRGLLKIHLSSSQAPLVASSSTSGGHGRHSYWLILSASAHFKWATKSEARHDAERALSVLSLTVSRRGLAQVIFQTPPKYILQALLIAQTVH